ncbi:DUF4198 domain-containing protein [Thermodesulfobacteriota bacterium]
MKRLTVCLGLILSIMLICSGSPRAHFGMVIPSTDVVGPNDSKEITLLLQFTHPFEGGPQMQLDKPKKFGVVLDGKASDLLSTLKENKVDGKSTWTTSYKIKRPGDYLFYMLPKGYWEPAEDKFILHVTKVIVDALGAEEGWDSHIAKPAGLPCEIVPLSRPYSLYAGNVFVGQVFRNGKRVPNCEVEVEWFGGGRTKAPTDTHVTQVVKADDNGVFCFGMPKGGWWGFAALMEGPEKVEHKGEFKSVELGAVIWVHARPMQ